ncbi:MAG: hypothetical protein LBT55_06230 [Clostridiaceae bacterium]|nr:hypothetical protein [Clostridiaceae bacterium]
MEELLTIAEKLLSWRRFKLEGYFKQLYADKRQSRFLKSRQDLGGVFFGLYKKDGDEESAYPWKENERREEAEKEQREEARREREKDICCLYASEPPKRPADDVEKQKLRSVDTGSGEKSTNRQDDDLREKIEKIGRTAQRQKEESLCSSKTADDNAAEQKRQKLQQDELHAENEKQYKIVSQAEIDQFAAQKKEKQRAKSFPFNTFRDLLIDLERKNAIKSPEVYKAACLDKQLYSNYIGGKATPNRRSLLKLAIGFHLDVEKTTRLFAFWGHSFPYDDTESYIAIYMEKGTYEKGGIVGGIYKSAVEYAQDFLGTQKKLNKDLVFYSLTERSQIDPNKTDQEK